MFECFHFLTKSVIWECDYDFEDFGYEGEGIVQILKCSNCGAEIEYKVPSNPPKEETSKKDEEKKKEKANN